MQSPLTLGTRSKETACTLKRSAYFDASTHQAPRSNAGSAQRGDVGVEHSRKHGELRGDSEFRAEDPMHALQRTRVAGDSRRDTTGSLCFDQCAGSVIVIPAWKYKPPWYQGCRPHLDAPRLPDLLEALSP